MTSADFGEGYFGPGSLGGLSGLRVLEFGQYVAGPMAGMLLADEGAAVLKVERPGGDPARAVPSFAVWNRGKRSIEIDLADEKHSELVSSLLSSAEVVINNLSAKATQRLGIGYERAMDLNPKVVYCTMPGFTPQLNLPAETAWDPLIMTMLGFETTISHSDGQPPGDDLPLHTPLPIPSVVAAITSASAIVAALAVRDRSGVGQQIEVPLHSAALVILSLAAMGTNDGTLQRIYRLPMAGRFICGDGRYIQLQGAERHFAIDLMRALGHPEWMEEAGLAYDKGLDLNGYLEWSKRIEGVLAESDAEEWERRLNDANLVCTMVRSIEEWMSSEHARDADLVTEVSDASLGRMLQPGRAISLSTVEHGPLTHVFPG